MTFALLFPGLESVPGNVVDAVLLTAPVQSFYSSYGVSATQLTAPGGDSVFGRTPQAPNGRVLSTYPPYEPCLRSVQEPVTDPTEPTAFYCYLQGTSMASPHVAGTAALIISRFGRAMNPQNGKMRPDQVEAYLDQTAHPQPCPAALPPGYETFLGVNSQQPQSCQGGPGYNSWYGNGQVNALQAVLHDAGNGSTVTPWTHCPRFALTRHPEVVCKMLDAVIVQLLAVAAEVRQAINKA